MRHIPANQLNVAGRWVCALTGRTDDPEGFIDSSRDLVVMGTDNLPRELEYRAAICDAAVKEAARMIGWYAPEDVDTLKAQLAEYGEKVDALTAYAAKLEQRDQLDRELAEVAA